MLRQIIKIDQDKCDGCGLCVTACHEGAIDIQNGKATIVRDDFCDGLGGCLPVCPTDAITFETREAAEYNSEEVKKHTLQNNNPSQIDDPHYSCPSSIPKRFNIDSENHSKPTSPSQTYLQQWPIQIKLVPTNAPFFDHAHLLIAADCTAFAYGNFHSEYMKNKITIIGCPKLDDIDYSEKLTSILKWNNIKSVVVVRMEVPCCKGIETAVKNALLNCGRMIPWQTITFSTDGKVLE